jgi:glucose/arabinose dehydrogenase
LALAAILLAACGPTEASTPRPQPSLSTSPQPTSSSRPTASPEPNDTPSPPAANSPDPPATVIGTPPPGLELSAELFVEGLPPLTFLANAGDGSGSLYAVGQTGVISVLSSEGSVQVEPFLDIQDRVMSGGERGLLGLAFHPDYESNGRLFVNYTDLDGNTVVSEFARAGEPLPLESADAGSERILLTIDQPFANHNGGMIAFGPDGYLYIGMGDGGGGGDPQGSGQDPGTLLGKMLRIDVDSGDPYGIPADNPFVGGDALPEIWSFGLRNPWRFSFDRETGAMFIADVGQGAREEIDAEAAGAGGRNYGWNIMEGEICFRDPACDATGLTLPVAVNDRSGGECAITGGYVYRGGNWDPELTGAYVYSDYCAGTLWILDADTALAEGTVEVLELGEVPFRPSSFGEDEAGELYLVNLEGEIYRLIATPR